MFGLFRARAEVRAAHDVLDSLDVYTGSVNELPSRIAHAITSLRRRAITAEAEAAALKRKYEPVRQRVPAMTGGTVVQGGLGLKKSPLPSPAPAPVNNHTPSPAPDYPAWYPSVERETPPPARETSPRMVSGGGGDYGGGGASASYDSGSSHSSSSDSSSSSSDSSSSSSSSSD